MGSPPPMRGKACPATDSATPTGITPAYAGKRLALLAVIDVVRDHPRLCGEKLLCLSTRRESVGSPPPMRGKGTLRSNVEHTNGITPAYAGKR